MEYFPRSTREFKYSVVRLIELVKTRPIIWDSSRAEFRSYSNKERVWKEIYQALDDKYRSSDKRTQADVGMRITAKWRNIRDAFLRSYRKRALHKKVKKYMYHDNLSFMLPILEAAQSPQRRLSSISESTTENLTEQSVSYDGGNREDPLVTEIKVEPDDYEQTDYNDPVTAVLKVEIEDEELSPVSFANLKRRNEDLDKTNEETVPSKVKRIEDQEHENPQTRSFQRNRGNKSRDVTIDEDESFFASISSLVRDMNEDEKLDFRLGVLKLIHETRQKRRKTTSKISSTRN